MNGSLPFYSRKRKDDPEARLQKVIIQHLELAAAPGVLWLHIPNQGKRSVAMGAELKRMGLRPGASDLLFVKDGQVYFLEVKAKDGRLSDEQKQFAVDACDAGATVGWCYSIDDALRTLRSWGILRSRAA